jgi:hypothetical protein
VVLRRSADSNCPWKKFGSTVTVQPNRELLIQPEDCFRRAAATLDATRELQAMLAQMT